MIKRIGILGAGAIGSVVGGCLTKAGRDVTLIDQWPEHVEAMKAKGLRLSGTIGCFAQGWSTPSSLRMLGATGTDMDSRWERSVGSSCAVTRR